ncbi:MAG: UDP-2,3-diacylglucosamine diphosphatase [Cytophagaceae bacterium]
MRQHYKTIVLSDIHLGTKGSKAKEIANFLKYNSADKLILNGDIIDGWQLRKSGKWKKNHTKFFKRIIQMIETFNTEVIYTRGNHDDFLDQIMPFRMGKISIQRDYIHESNGKKYYVVHGDIFDSITTNLKWIAKLGDIGYTLLLWINQRYNDYRTNRGLPYYSLSQAVKAKVKSAVSYISNFEDQLIELAKIKKCDGIICGHIHQPAIKYYGSLIYMNSGDWVETLSALVETMDGKWELVYFNEQDTLSLDLNDELEDDDLDEIELPNPDLIFLKAKT